MDFNQSLTFQSKSHFVTPYKHMDKKKYKHLLTLI